MFTKIKKEIIRWFGQKDLVLWLVVGLLTNLAIWLLVWWRIDYNDQAIPLHYNIAFGIDWYDSWFKIFIYPVFGLLVILINFFLSVWLNSYHKTLALFLQFSTWLCQLIIFVSLLALVINYF